MNTADVERLRQETPGCANRIHLNNSGASLPSRAVVDAVIDHLRLEEAIGPYEAADERAEEQVAFYVAAATLVGAAPEEIAFCDSATRAWNGDRAELPFNVDGRLWADSLASDPEDCLGPKCGNWTFTPHRIARLACEDAQIIITNHALYFALPLVRSLDRSESFGRLLKSRPRVSRQGMNIGVVPQCGQRSRLARVK